MAVDHYIEDGDNVVPVDAVVEGKTGTIDFNTLKSGGIIKQRQKSLFTVRLKCPGGRVPMDRLDKIIKVARKYGRDYVHLSVRQSIEIPYVDIKDIGPIQEELGEVSQEIASCGARVRVPTACSGCEYNPNGLTDTQKMASSICDGYFGRGPLAHKFKMSFSGCPIDCARSCEMDLGFQGAVNPEWDQETCIGCRICASACHEGAIDSDPDTGEPIYYPEKCLFCGDCIRNCPTEAWSDETTGWIVRCGGKHGRHPILGQKIALFVPDEKIPDVIDAVLGWYEENGKDKGRTRIGTLLSDEATWKSFLADIAEAVGEYAVTDSPAPQPKEFHFNTNGSK